MNSQKRSAEKSDAPKFERITTPIINHFGKKLKTILDFVNEMNLHNDSKMVLFVLNGNNLKRTN